MTVGEALARARPALAATGGDAVLDAQILLGHVLGRGRAWLVAHRDDALTAAQASAFEKLLARRRDGEPVAYLLGRREFWSLDLAVDRRVLIPRPDTERLVERALARLPEARDAIALDAGTGSGAVALAVAVERPRVTVLASDRDRGALAVAAANAARVAPGRIRLLCADWLGAVAAGRLDVVVSNPPYVAPHDAHLARGDVRFEPRGALVAARDGLAAIAALAGQAPRCLKPGGWLLVEHGADQAAAVRDLFTAAGFTAVATCVDLAGRDRVTEGRWPGAAFRLAP